MAFVSKFRLINIGKTVLAHQPILSPVEYNLDSIGMPKVIKPGIIKFILKLYFLDLEIYLYYR